jgi:hypothetical protein
MLKKILIALTTIVVVFLVIVALQPADYEISRSQSVAAPPAQVFAQVNDLHNFNTWNPFAKLDPQAKIAYSGPRAGRDASFAWAGNDQMGEGRMTIIESRPDEAVRMKLDFVKPFASTADAEFTLKPAGDRTVVTWTMTGKNAFIGKIFSVFMNMDKMIGSDFERGLASMQGIVESRKN